ncbi:hypothetical protein BANRA_04217 [Acinetobacter baumannii]|nr:hypothetical protein BANRA_04217 [Acinetobacter baumannii]
MIENKFMKFLLFLLFAIMGSTLSYMINNIIPLIILLVIYGLIVKDPALRAHKFLEREVYFVPCDPSTSYMLLLPPFLLQANNKTHFEPHGFRSQ